MLAHLDMRGAELARHHRAARLALFIQNDPAFLVQPLVQLAVYALHPVGAEMPGPGHRLRFQQRLHPHVGNGQLLAAAHILVGGKLLLQRLLQIGGIGVLPLDLVGIVGIHRAQQLRQRGARARAYARQQARRGRAQIGGSLHQRQLLGLVRQHRLDHVLRLHLADCFGESCLVNTMNNRLIFNILEFYWRNPGRLFEPAKRSTRATLPAAESTGPA